LEFYAKEWYLPCLSREIKIKKKSLV